MVLVSMVLKMRVCWTEHNVCYFPIILKNTKTDILKIILWSALFWPAFNGATKSVKSKFSRKGL